MNILEKIKNPAYKERLNEYCMRYTFFSSFDELLSANYKPEMKIDNDVPNITRRELLELADAYDEYMRLNNDPRAIYRHP